MAAVVRFEWLRFVRSVNETMTMTMAMTLTLMHMRQACEFEASSSDMN